MTIFVKRGAETSGPLSEEAIRAALVSGDLHDSSMSWVEGEKAWTSLGKRFSTQPVKWKFLTLFLVLVCEVLVFIAAQNITSLLHLFPPFEGRNNLSYVLIAVPIAVLCIALGLGLCGYGKFLPRLSRGQWLGVAALAFPIIVLALWVATLLADAERYKEGKPNAVVGVTGDGQTLYISGRIGNRLLWDVKRALSNHRQVKEVDIKSEGGFLQEALRVADLISSQGLNTSVEEVCASACVYVWISGRQRYLAEGAVIGLHRPRFDGFDVNTLAGQALKDEMVAESMSTTEQRLQDAGFNKLTLEARGATASNSLHLMKPSDVAASGVQFVLRPVNK